MDVTRMLEAPIRLENGANKTQLDHQHCSCRAVWHSSGSTVWDIEFMPSLFYLYITMCSYWHRE